MSSRSVNYSHRIVCIGVAFAFALLLVLAPISANSIAFAASPSESTAEQFDQTGSSDGAVPENTLETADLQSEDPATDGTDGVDASTAAETAALSDADDDAIPIKPRPKVEITTGVVTLEPVVDDVIADEITPLAAFDIEPCFIHLLMIAGIGVTVGYTFFAYRRTHCYTQYMNGKTSELTRGAVLSSEATSKPSEAPISVGTPIETDR